MQDKNTMLRDTRYVMVEVLVIANSTLFFVVLFGASLLICSAIVIESNSHHRRNSHPWEGATTWMSSFCQHLDPPFGCEISAFKKAPKKSRNFTSNRPGTFPFSQGWIAAANLKMKFPAFCTIRQFFCLKRTCWVRQMLFEQETFRNIDFVNLVIIESGNRDMKVAFFKATLLLLDIFLQILLG